jgi:hypothetical protein
MMKDPIRLGTGDRIKFKYTNWRDERHEYVVQVESIHFDPGSGGWYGPGSGGWYLNGETITRDGDPREDMGVRRRSFYLNDLEAVEKVIA